MQLSPGRPSPARLERHEPALALYASSGNPGVAQDPDRCPARQRVLWIDDDIDSSSPEVTLLQLDGFDVDCAQTGAHGLTLATERTYDAVVLDLRLPDEFGLEVLEALTTSGVSAPIVILTGYADVESAVGALKRGAADYRAKPVDAGELSSLLRGLAADVARAPHAKRRPMTEGEWLGVQSDRLAAGPDKAAAIALLVETLVDTRLTLRRFFGCAAALKLAFAARDMPLVLLVRDIRNAIAQSASIRTPSHPKVLQALAALEREGSKQAKQVLAQRIELSRAYFSRVTMRDTGHHAAEWIRVAAMRTAFRVVVQSTEPISQIAYSVGYEHPSQFDRDFFTLFGLSPTALRRRLATLARPGRFS